eukprot:13106188-Alexandrium_andersonii.AAC.1
MERERTAAEKRAREREQPENERESGNRQNGIPERRSHTDTPGWHASDGKAEGLPRATQLGEGSSHRRTFGRQPNEVRTGI